MFTYTDAAKFQASFDALENDTATLTQVQEVVGVLMLVERDIHSRLGPKAQAILKANDPKRIAQAFPGATPEKIEQIRKIAGGVADDGSEPSVFYDRQHDKVFTPAEKRTYEKKLAEDAAAADRAKKDAEESAKTKAKEAADRAIDLAKQAAKKPVAG